MSAGTSNPRTTPARPAGVTVSACELRLAEAGVLLAEQIRIGQVPGGAIMVLGPWLTRRPSVIPAAVRAWLAADR